MAMGPHLQRNAERKGSRLLPQHIALIFKKIIHNPICEKFDTMTIVFDSRNNHSQTTNGMILHCITLQIFTMLVTCRFWAGHTIVLNLVGCVSYSSTFKVLWHSTGIVVLIIIRKNIIREFLTKLTIVNAKDLLCNMLQNFRPIVEFHGEGLG